MTTPEHCGNCTLPALGESLTLGWGLLLCRHCGNKFEQTEKLDSAYWTVSWCVGGMARREITFNNDSPGAFEAAKGFAEKWGGKMVNNYGHVIFNYEND